MADISRNEINSNFYQIVETDANGNILYIKSEFVPAGNVVAGGSNGAVQFNQNNIVSGSNGFTFDSNTNTVTAGAFVGSGTQLTNILATNVDGTIANATYAVTAGTVESISGSNVIGPVSEASTANISNTALSVSGANVTGPVASAVSSTTAATVTTNAQPNITSVGTLTSVNVTGNVSAGAVKTDSLLQANGTPYVFTSNAAGSNTQIQFNSNGAFAANSFFTFDSPNTKLSLDNSSLGNGVAPSILLKRFVGGIGGGDISINITSDGITGAETGIVTSLPTISGFNITANSLSVAGRVNSNLVPSNSNITLGNTTTGWGNLHLAANTRIWFGNLTGAFIQAAPSALSTANTLTFTTGNVVANSTVTAQRFVGEGGNISNIQGANVSGAVANATYAVSAGSTELSNIANIAYSVAGANVSGTVANATFALTSGSATISNAANVAYSVSGSNVVGTVANATHSVYSDQSNSVTGSNVVGQVGNALIASTVYSNAQPNITSIGSLVSLDVDGNIVGHSNITGDYFIGNGAFLTGVGDFSAAKGYHGSFYSNVSQTITSTTTAYPITLNNTDPDSYGIFVSSNSHVNFTYAGTYNVQYSIQFVNTDNAIHTASVWLRKNGVDVPDTNTIFDITASRSGVNGHAVGALNYIVDAEADDYIELIWQAESTQVSLEYIGPGTTPTSPASPSVIVTAMQVTNVQAATLSGDLTGNLIANSYGFTGTGFINITGNIHGGQFIGNAGGLTGIVGGNVLGFVANASHANISDIANVAYSVSASNVVGTVANATHSVTSDSANSVTAANVIGTVANATFATSAGSATVADSANSVAGANVSGAVANATFATSAGSATIASSANSVAGSNVSGAVANATYAVSAGSASTADTANSVAGSNVSGQVANAANAAYADISGIAYSVAVANVSGIGNIATINLNGNTNQVLYGNGIFAGLPAYDSNYANFAGEAFSVSASNIVGVVNLANFAGVANSVAGANVSGEVANATYATSAGLASLAAIANSVAGANVSGAVANATFATSSGTTNSVAGANVSGTVANATFATTAGSTEQANIANIAYSVSASNISGTVNLANFATTANSVTGANVSGAVANATYAVSAGSATVADTANSVAGANVTGQVSYAAVANSVAGANVTGTVANATFATSSGSATIANSVAGANVTGTVANATFATTSGTTNSVAVANVSGIGNIATINLNGNGSQVLAGNGVFITPSSGGTPGGSNTQLQFNNNGSFGGISTVTYDGVNLSLGSVSNIKITGGANTQVLSTDGTGNLSWVSQSGGGGGTETFAPFLLAGM